MTSFAYLGREYEYFDAFDLINESNHYSEIFDEFINDIVDNIEQYIGKEKDTGWYYNMRDYNVNKNGVGVKLKLIIEDLSKLRKSGYIDPNRFPEITIHLSNKLLTNYKRLKSVLLHELTHVINVYIKNRNGAETIKETLLNELTTYQYEFDIKYRNTEISKNVYNALYNLFYVITYNEQLATINETCKYLSECSVIDIHTFLKQCIKSGVSNNDLIFQVNGTMSTRSAQVYNVLVYLKEYHFLNYMLHIINKFEDINLSLKLLIAYYLNKHGYIRKPKLHYITYDVVYSAVHSGSKFKVSKNIEDELYHVYDCIYDNFEKYKKKLYDAIYVIMEQNNMFLPIDEVYEIIPYYFKRLLEQNLIEY